MNPAASARPAASAPCACSKELTHAAHGGQGQARSDLATARRAWADGHRPAKSLRPRAKLRRTPCSPRSKYFREEFEAHIERALPRGQVQISHRLLDYRHLHRLHEMRAGLSCGLHRRFRTLRRCITFNLDTCTRCDACLVACPVDAILAGSRTDEESGAMPTLTINNHEITKLTKELHC